MLVFIVPLKSSKISRNWPLMCNLLQRTLKSICQQTAETFRVVVVANEQPDLGFTHPHLHWVLVDFPPPMAEPDELATRGYELAHSADMARKNADKARKIRTGLDFATRFLPTHIMVVDSDDCVSRNLATFVAQDPLSPGWYCKKGYFYTEGSRFLYLNRQNFNVICGTSAIVSFSQRNLLLANPDFYQHAFHDPPGGLTPLPFVGAIYSMANGDNIYMSADTRNHIYGSLLKRVFSRELFALVAKVISYRPTLLTGAHRLRYGLYPIQNG